MSKTITEKRKTVAKGSKGSAKLTKRSVRGIVQLQPRKPGTTTTLSSASFVKMVKSSRVELTFWSSTIHMSTNTLKKRIESKAGFDALQADRLLAVDQVLKRGIEVFEDPQDLMDWLKEKHTLLDDQRPIDLLGTTAGIGLVMLELGRIEHGIY